MKQHLKEFGMTLLFIGTFFILWIAFVNIFNL